MLVGGADGEFLSFSRTIEWKKTEGETRKNLVVFAFCFLFSRGGWFGYSFIRFDRSRSWQSNSVVNRSKTCSFNSDYQVVRKLTCTLRLECLGPVRPSARYSECMRCYGMPSLRRGSYRVYGNFLSSLSIPIFDDDCTIHGWSRGKNKSN